MEQTSRRTYVYGLVVVETPQGRQEVRAYVRTENKGPPRGAVVAKWLTGTAASAQMRADEMASAFAHGVPIAVIAASDHAVAEDGPSLDDPPPAFVVSEAEIVRGSVAQYHDGAQHMAIVLSVGEAMHDALFFTSNDQWTVARRATTEELALAGFVYKRPTYLGLVRRPAGGFLPTGIVFPDHRVEALRREFGIEESP